MMFSVIIPTYNRSNIVSRAINSVVNQSYNNWELIIVDDGSVDSTKKLVRSYLNDPRINYIYQENKGVSSARNFGASIAKGKFLVFLDSDDKLDEQAFESFIKIKEKESIILCGAVKKINSSSIEKIIYPSYGKFVGTKTKSLFLAGSFAIKARIFLEIGGYDNRLKHSENTDLMINLFSKYDPKITSTTKVVVEYFQSNEGGSKDLQNKVYALNLFLEKYSSLLERNKKLKGHLLFNCALNYKSLGQYYEFKRYLFQAFRIDMFDVKILWKFIKILVK